jgi:hypothetical protein
MHSLPAAQQSLLSPHHRGVRSTSCWPAPSSSSRSSLLSPHHRGVRSTAHFGLLSFASALFFLLSPHHRGVRSTSSSTHWSASCPLLSPHHRGVRSTMRRPPRSEQVRSSVPSSSGSPLNLAARERGRSDQDVLLSLIIGESAQRHERDRADPAEPSVPSSSGSPLNEKAEALQKVETFCPLIIGESAQRKSAQELHTWLSLLSPHHRGVRSTGDGHQHGRRHGPSVPSSSGSPLNASPSRRRTTGPLLSPHHRGVRSTQLACSD